MILHGSAPLTHSQPSRSLPSPHQPPQHSPTPINKITAKIRWRVEWRSDLVWRQGLWRLRVTAFEICREEWRRIRRLNDAMGKETEVSVMEIDDPKSNNSDQIIPKFSTNVLQLLKSAQMQHGLRHGDYTRYRRYSTARLRRLCKSLKFTHGRGKYNKRAINESTITDVRFLHMVLYTAERAWSHAMEKRQLPDGPNARQYQYLIGRLRKAVKWGSLFSNLCAIKGDSRTNLEAEVIELGMNFLTADDMSALLAIKLRKRLGFNRHAC